MHKRRNAGPILEEQVKALGDAIVIPPERLWTMVQQIGDLTPADALVIEAAILYQAAKEDGATPFEAPAAITYEALTVLEGARREKLMTRHAIEQIAGLAFQERRQSLQAGFGERIETLQAVRAHIQEIREGRDLLGELKQKQEVRPDIAYSFRDVLMKTRIPDRPQLEAGMLLGYIFSSQTYTPSGHGEETLHAYVEPTRRIKNKSDMHRDRKRAEAVAQALSETSERTFNYRPTTAIYQRGWRLGFDSRAVLSWTGAFGLKSGTYKTNDPWFAAGIVAGLAARIGRVEERGRKIYLILEKVGTAAKPYALAARACDSIVKRVTDESENGWLRTYPHLKGWDPTHPAPSADGRRLLFGQHNTDLLSRGEPFAGTPFAELACGFYVRPIDVDRARRHRDKA